jgi:PKD repeat protein
MSTPVANFSFAPYDVVAAGSVQMTDLSANSPTSWYWQFDNGDGTFASSYEQNPAHWFQGPPYLWRSIQLTVANADGQDTLKVGPYPGGLYIRPPHV